VTSLYWIGGGLNEITGVGTVTILASDLDVCERLL
jgi:hypothetical protein